jgi:hypothetical protein
MMGGAAPKLENSSHLFEFRELLIKKKNSIPEKLKPHPSHL